MTTDERERHRRFIELWYQLWTRLCEMADELMSIADAWYEIDPDIIELHSKRAGFTLPTRDGDEEE